jgi:hypothetical protein
MLLDQIKTPIEEASLAQVSGHACIRINRELIHITLRVIICRIELRLWSQKQQEGMVIS